MHTTYPAYGELIEWLNHSLSPVEQSVFQHYAGIRRLSSLVDRAERGTVSKYAALEAIDAHNKREGDCLSYAEVLSRDSTYVFSDLGDWVLYVDNMDAGLRILSLDVPDLESAAMGASPDIKWLVSWIPQDDEVIVIRSPHTGRRGPLRGGGSTDGCMPGDIPCYVLPPEIEASFGSLCMGELMFQHSPTWDNGNTPSRSAKR